MKRKIKMKSKADWPIGRLKEIDDFLPSPEKLVPVEDMVKVTLSLDQQSVDFFKITAARLGAKYQRMMREVLRGYAQRYIGRRC